MEAGVGQGPDQRMEYHEADTVALGIPLLASMYPTASDLVRASVQIPVILYTAEQIFVGQFMVWWFKRWLARDKAKRAKEELERERSLAGSERGSAEAGIDGPEGGVGMEGAEKLGEGEADEKGRGLTREKV